MLREPQGECAQHTQARAQNVRSSRLSVDKPHDVSLLFLKTGVKQNLYLKQTPLDVIVLTNEKQFCATQNIIRQGVLTPGVFPQQTGTMGHLSVMVCLDRGHPADGTTSSHNSLLNIFLVVLIFQSLRQALTENYLGCGNNKKASKMESSSTNFSFFPDLIHCHKFLFSSQP